ncbi:hypothetical protein I3843_11G013600 [Carya illinoinensis]|nr:hypothetical protein I3843_11G013600 [Carya illinoinensis]KAG7954382.1 hypothetical protein I3843_11G013600 [Carya illinoinensis]
MASRLHMLTKKTPSVRILPSTLKTPLFLEPDPLLIPNQNHLCTKKHPDREHANDLDSFLRHSFRAKVESPQTLRFFPSFPFGFCLNPVFSTGFERLAVLEAEDVEPVDDARRVWADSVKKKRKKKMNKHKYKKLRKRLRRKARS